MYQVALPWPPSANKYWRYVKGMVLVSREARAYKALVKKMALLWGHRCLEGRLLVKIAVYPPDKRKRDLDNLLKVTLDALQGAGLYKDDAQIDVLSIERKLICSMDGEIIVYLKELSDEEIKPDESALNA